MLALGLSGFFTVGCTTDGSSGQPTSSEAAALRSSTPTAMSTGVVSTNVVSTSAVSTNVVSTSAVPTSAPSPSAAPTSGSVVPTVRRAGVIDVLPTSERVVALTFDGGADSQGAARIVATLLHEGVPASFFVTGRFAAANPSLVAELATIGPVGNHSWDHPHLPALDDAAARTQLSSTRAKILAVTGRDPVPFFRFPFGDSDARTRNLVAAQGYVAVGWTVDSLGWQGTSGGQSADKVAARVVGAARPGEIVLMHLGAHPSDHSTLDADALGQVITRLRSQGYRFVTLDALR